MGIRDQKSRGPPLEASLANFGTESDDHRVKAPSDAIAFDQVE